MTARRSRVSPSTWKQRALPWGVSGPAASVEAEWGCPGWRGLGWSSDHGPFTMAFHGDTASRVPTSPASPCASLPACHTWSRHGETPPVRHSALLKLSMWTQIGFRFGAVQWCWGRRGGLCSVLCCAGGKPVCPLIPHLSFVQSDASNTASACPGSEQELFLPVLPGRWGGFRLPCAGEGLNCCLPRGSSLNRASSSRQTPQEPHLMNSSFPCSRGGGVLGMGTGGFSAALGNPAIPRDAPSPLTPWQLLLLV